MLAVRNNVYVRFPGQSPSRIQCVMQCIIQCIYMCVCACVRVSVCTIIWFQTYLHTYIPIYIFQMYVHTYIFLCTWLTLSIQCAIHLISLFNMNLCPRHPLVFAMYCAGCATSVATPKHQKSILGKLCTFEASAPSSLASLPIMCTVEALYALYVYSWSLVCAQLKPCMCTVKALYVHS